MNFKNKLYKESNEVYYFRKDIISNTMAFDFLKERSKKNKRKTSRICFHKNIKSAVHKMLICHQKSFHIKPHLHKTKIESCLVLKGSMDVLFYNSRGEVTHKNKMSSDNNFFITIPSNIFHSMKVTSNYVIFFEITKGPFSKKHTTYPKW